jgi:hypothetical protein
MAIGLVLGGFFPTGHLKTSFFAWVILRAANNPVFSIRWQKFRVKIENPE